MKFVALLLCLLSGIISSAVMAMNFRLNPQMNLLVLDGHKLPGSLLKGADGIELEKGQHQILFTIDQQQHSPAFIITFTAQSQTVSIVMPSPAPHGEVQPPIPRNFRFRVLDEKGQELPAIQDHLPVQAGLDYVAEMAAYNRLNRKASVERFTLPVLQTDALSENSSSGTLSQPLPSASGSAPLSGWSLQTLVSWFREHRTS